MFAGLGIGGGSKKEGGLGGSKSAELRMEARSCKTILGLMELRHYLHYPLTHMLQLFNFFGRQTILTLSTTKDLLDPIHFTNFSIFKFCRFQSPRI